MKRSPVGLTNAVGRTIEDVLVDDCDCLALLLSGDAYLQIVSGCYDENDHYLEVDFDSGITLVKHGWVSTAEALQHRLITQDEADQFEAEKKAKVDSARADRLALYEQLKREFG